MSIKINGYTVQCDKCQNRLHSRFGMETRRKALAEAKHYEWRILERVNEHLCKRCDELDLDRYGFLIDSKILKRNIKAGH